MGRIVDEGAVASLWICPDRSSRGLGATSTEPEVFFGSLARDPSDPTKPEPLLKGVCATVESLAATEDSIELTDGAGPDSRGDVAWAFPSSIADFNTPSAAVAEA